MNTLHAESDKSDKRARGAHKLHCHKNCPVVVRRFLRDAGSDRMPISDHAGG